MWKDPAEMEHDQKWAGVKLIAFLFCSINLLFSIVLTITTPPGYIPEDNEWDMPTASEDTGSVDKLSHKNSEEIGGDQARGSGMSDFLKEHNRAIDKQARRANKQQE